MKRGGMLLAATLAVAGCTSAHPSPAASPPVPSSVADRAPLPACGTENATTQSGPWNAAARQCFWDAYQQGQPAEFISTRLTIEGDPITTIYRVLGPRKIEIFEDTTQDKFSNPRAWLRFECQSLGTVSTLAPSPDFGPDGSCVQTTIG